MEIYTQIKNIIEKSRDILILAPQKAEGDILGAALALFYSLKKLDKKVNLVLPALPEKFRFLPIPNHLGSLKAKRNFTISIDNSSDNIAEVYYDKSDSNLKIYLTLKKEGFDKNNITLDSQELDPDLLIALGGQNLESFGSLFEEDPQIFYEKPILNIDADSSNENFGEINLINITSSGVSEILTDFLRANYPGFVKDDIATCLLAGLISATQNFHSSKVTPKNLNTASYLIENGAQHQKIIQYFYKTKSPNSLKLLGQVLEKLNFDKEKEFYWASLTEQDFKSTQSSPKNLSNVLEELKSKFLNSSSLLLLWEGHCSEKSIKGIFYSPKKDLLRKISETYESWQKGKGVLFQVKCPDLLKTERDILSLL